MLLVIIGLRRLDCDNAKYIVFPFISRGGLLPEATSSEAKMQCAKIGQGVTLPSVHEEQCLVSGISRLLPGKPHAYANIWMTKNNGDPFSWNPTIYRRHDLVTHPVSSGLLCLDLGKFTQ